MGIFSKTTLGSAFTALRAGSIRIGTQSPKSRLDIRDKGTSAIVRIIQGSSFVGPVLLTQAGTSLTTVTKFIQYFDPGAGLDIQTYGGVNAGTFIILRMDLEGAGDVLIFGNSSVGGVGARIGTFQVKANLKDFGDGRVVTGTFVFGGQTGGRVRMQRVRVTASGTRRVYAVFPTPFSGTPTVTLGIVEPAGNINESPQVVRERSGSVGIQVGNSTGSRPVMVLAIGSA